MVSVHIFFERVVGPRADTPRATIVPSYCYFRCHQKFLRSLEMHSSVASDICRLSKIMLRASSALRTGLQGARRGLATDAYTKSPESFQKGQRQSTCTAYSLRATTQTTH